MSAVDDCGVDWLWGKRATYLNERQAGMSYHEETAHIGAAAREIYEAQLSRKISPPGKKTRV